MYSSNNSTANYYKSKRYIFTVLFALAMLLVFNKNSKAQFIYAGVGTQFNSVTFNKVNDPITTSGNEFTRLRHLDIQASFIYRPNYRFAIGTSVALPVFQNSQFTLHDAKALSGNWNDYNSEFRSGYVPDELSYDFKSSPSVSLFGRYYMDGVLNSYLQAGANFRRIEEEFRLLQLNPGNTMSPGDTDLSFNESFVSISPQIALGISPQFGAFTDHPFFERTYLDIYIAFAMVPTISKGFNYIVPYDEGEFNNEVHFVENTDQTDGYNRQFSAGFSFGFVL